MTEFRRLRTQDERGPEAWRRVAESRPGFATYPTTPPGDPSWWRRDPGPRWVAIPPPAPGRGWRVRYPDGDGPAPVDGETCKQWCGYCHLDPEPPRPHTVEWLARSATTEGPSTPDDLDELRARITEAMATGQPVVLPSGNVITPPRRRWWHRLTPWRNP